MHPHGKDNSSGWDSEARWKTALPGSKIGKYTVVRNLDSNSYSKLYDVHDDEGNRFTARVYHPKLKDILQGDFDRLPSLKHKYLVRTIECFEEENHLVYVYESIKGTDLRSKIKKLRSVDIIFCLETALRIVDCLSYLREKGIIHNHLHPKNIILTEYEDIKILNPVQLPSKLMKALLLENEKERISYYPPEMLDDSGESKREDIYFFGALFFLMLTGKDPYSGLSPERILSNKTDKDSRIPLKTGNDIDKELSTIIKSCMEMNPADRPASFSEIRNLLMKSINKYKVKKLKNPPEWKAYIFGSVTALIGIGIITGLFFLITGNDKKPGEISAVLKLEARRTDPWGNTISFRMVDGATVYSNDGFRFQIIPDRDFYISAISLAPDGKTRSLIPSSRKSIFMKMKKGEKRVFPGERKWYKFDDTAGEELIYIVLCSEEWKILSNTVSEKPFSEAANKEFSDHIKSLLDDKLVKDKIIKISSAVPNPLFKMDQSYSLELKGYDIVVHKMRLEHK